MNRRVKLALAGAFSLFGAAGCEAIADIRDPVLDTSDSTSSSTSSTSTSSTSTSTSSSTQTDCVEAGIVMSPELLGAYRCVPVGETLDEAVHLFTGDLAFDPNDADTLYFVARSDVAVEHLRSVKLLRDADGHITGTGAVDTHVVDLPGATGVAFHPLDGTLFYTTADPPTLVQRATMNGADGMTIDLSTLGVMGRAETLGFVEEGLPGVGRLAISSSVSATEGYMYTGALTGATAGAHDLGTLAPSDDLLHGGGGFAYVAAGDPDVTPAILLANIWNSTVELRVIDAEAVPWANSIVLASFTKDGTLTGPWGMAVDRVSGDVLVMHYTDVRLFAIRGFPPPAPAP